MIKKIISKYKEKRILGQIELEAEQFLRYAENIKEEGGDVRQGADEAQKAIISAKCYSKYKTEAQEWADDITKRATSCQYAAYNPIKSKDPEIRRWAMKETYFKSKINEINTLEKMAEDRMKLGIEEAVSLAIEYHTSALEAAKDLKDPKLVEEIKTRFKEATKNYGK